MKELRYLNSFIFRYKWHVVFGFISVLISNIFAVFPAIYFGEALDTIIELLKSQESNSSFTTYEFRNKILLYVTIIIGSTVIKNILMFSTRQTIIVMSRLVEYDLKNKIYQHYQNLSISFYKNNKIGDMMSRLTEDVSHVRMFLGPAIMYSMNLSLMLIIVLVQMLRTDYILTLITLVPLPFLSVFIFKVSQHIHKKSSLKQVFIAKLTSFVHERISGIRVIKSFGIENHTLDKYNELAEDTRKKNMNLVKIESFFSPTIILMVGLSFLLILYIGGIRTINGHISIGEISEFVIYLNMIIWPVTALGWVSSLIQKAEASQKRINEYLNIKPDIQNYSKIHKPILGNIKFENVSFTYQNTGILALKNLTFTVKQGETLAVFGEIGSGKSTLVELLLRMYDVSIGRILIDGFPIKDWDLEILRSSFGYVPQEPFLFSQSIYDNIRFSIDQASEQEIIKAAKLSEIHEDIMSFKNQYKTVLGERGITVSGGQKQRISLARALIKKPSVYVFDDSLSAVDTKTEERILQNLRKISKNKTTIIVTHRISSARHASKILVLKDGEKSQWGTHKELILKSAYYRQIYEKQMLEKSEI